jgi:hypothetical protein
MVKLTDDDLIVLFIRWWIGDAKTDDLAVANGISYGHLNDVFHGRTRLNVRRKALEIITERNLKYEPLTRRKDRD